MAVCGTVEAAVFKEITKCCKVIDDLIIPRASLLTLLYLSKKELIFAWEGITTVNWAFHKVHWQRGHRVLL